MKRFQADVQLWATLYIVADSEAEAREKLHQIVKIDQALEVGSDENNSLDNEGSFMAPAMTCTGEMSRMYESGPFHGDTDYDEDEEQEEEVV